MVQQSQSIAGLAVALVAAQTEIENAVKNSVNPHFKNSYADLAEVINTLKPVLTKHGLAVTQFPGYDAETGTVLVTTVLMHTSGEWMSGVAGSPSPKKDPQGVGSAITYLRRYALAALGLIAQEDDDGEAASRRNAKQKEHDELLRTINTAVKANGGLQVVLEEKAQELGAFLRRRGSDVKDSLDFARTVVEAIEAANAAE